MSALSLQYFLQLESIIFSLFKSLTQLSLCFTSTCFSLPPTPNAMNLFKLICSIFLRKYAVFIELLPSDAISLCAFLSTKLGIKKLIWLQWFFCTKIGVEINCRLHGVIMDWFGLFAHQYIYLTFSISFQDLAILFHSTIFCTQELSFSTLFIFCRKKWNPQGY